MAFQTAPAWMENSDEHHAVIYRQMLAGVTGGAAGVVNAAALAVSERDGTANTSVDVAPGGAFIPSTRAAAQGSYFAYNDGTINVPLSAAHPTNDRIDRILIQVRDSAQDVALTQDDNRIYVVEGEPASVPELPEVDVDDWIELARVLVPAGSTSITNADITDVRVVIQSQSLVFTSSGAFAPGDYPGLKAVTATVIGGGGGGGGAASQGAGWGSGGGAGGMRRETIPVSQLASSESVVVGAGGAGGTNDGSGSGTSGNSGGTSSFAGLTANGGAGGSGMPGGTDFRTRPGGDGGSVSGGGAGSHGNRGQPGAASIRLDGTNGVAGNGGSSWLGGGGAGQRNDGSGQNGSTNSGAGGAGAASSTSGGAASGGAGAAGCVILDLLF